MSIAHPPRPHGDHRPSRSDARDRARIEHRLAGFRHRSLLFELVDHEAAPTVLAVLASGAALLIALLAATGGVGATVGGTPPLLAWLAGLCLLAALVVGASEAVAWLLSRPIGWTLARSACALEDARAAVERLAPVHLGPEADPELRLAATRVNRAVTTVIARLADADAAIVAYARITDPETREGRLELLRQEARSIHDAADAVDSTAHLLRWIEACPWSAARPDALTLLRTDLATAERLLTEGALR
jgi:hypothetical protein